MKDFNQESYLEGNGRVNLMNVWASTAWNMVIGENLDRK